MGSETTRQRLLSNAERLMAEKGIAATSVREITDASDANVASVNYYFGSKKDLLLELLKSRFLQLDAELLEGLNAVESERRDAMPDVEALTGAYFDALFALGYRPETGRPDPFLLLIQRASSEQQDILVKAQDYSSPGIAKLISLFAATHPLLDESAIDGPVLVGLMFTTSVDAIEVMQRPDRNPDLVEAIRVFLVAGVKAYLGSLAGERN